MKLSSLKWWTQTVPTSYLDSSINWIKVPHWTRPDWTGPGPDPMLPQPKPKVMQRRRRRTGGGSSSALKIRTADPPRLQGTVTAFNIPNLLHCHLVRLGSIVTQLSSIVPPQFFFGLKYLVLSVSVPHPQEKPQYCNTGHLFFPTKI